MYPKTLSSNGEIESRNPGGREDELNLRVKLAGENQVPMSLASMGFRYKLRLTEPGRVLIFLVQGLGSNPEFSAFSAL